MQAAGVYALPFEDDTFDMVFCDIVTPVIDSAFAGKRIVLQE